MEMSGVYEHYKVDLLGIQHNITDNFYTPVHRVQDVWIKIQTSCPFNCKNAGNVGTQIQISISLHTIFKHPGFRLLKDNLFLVCPYCHRQFIIRTDDIINKIKTIYSMLEEI